MGNAISLVLRRRLSRSLFSLVEKLEVDPTSPMRGEQQQRARECKEERGERKGKEHKGEEKRDEERKQNAKGKKIGSKAVKSLRGDRD